MTPFVFLAAAACTWPTVFANSTWLDSVEGELVFTTTTMTGYALTVVSAWECYETTSFDTDGTIVFR